MKRKTMEFEKTTWNNYLLLLNDLLSRKIITSFNVYFEGEDRTIIINMPEPPQDSIVFNFGIEIE
jgi:hypothetical protein